jgi:hypothetical protein
MDADRDKLDQAHDRQDASSKRAEEAEAESKRLGLILDKQAHERQHERDKDDQDAAIKHASERPSQHNDKQPPA